MKRFIALALLVLVSCTSPPPLGSRVFTTHSGGGEALPWELKVWNANKTVSRTGYTNTAPGGISEGGFAWETEGNGNCVQMTFEGIPDLLDILPRDTVQLLVDGTPVFYGTVELPAAKKSERLTYTVVGAKKSFERVIPLARRFTGIANAGQVITASSGAGFNRDGLRVDLPPHVTYSAARVSGALPALAAGWRSGSSGESLAQTLDTLASASSNGANRVSWGVDATGTFFFGVPSGTWTVGYAASGWDDLPVNASDVVSRVGVLLSGKNPLLLTTNQRITNSYMEVGSPDNDPIVYRTSSTADHTLYRQEITVPAGSNDWFVTTLTGPTGAFGVGLVNGFTNPANAYDGDPSTYAESNGTPPDLLLVRTEGSASAFEAIYGFEFEYSTSGFPTTSSLVGFVIANNGITPVFSVPFSVPGTSSHDSRNRVRVLFQLPVVATQLQGRFIGPAMAAGVLRLYTLMPLTVSSRIDDYAKSFIWLPAVVATELESSSIVAPQPTATITGVPPSSSTVVAPAPSWQYELKRGGRKTKVQVGDRSAGDSSRVIVRTIRDADARDLANARAYTDR